MLAKLSTRPTLRRCAVTGALGLALLGTGLPAAGDKAEPDLTRFYRQKVTWAKCPGDGLPKDLQCGKVTVPLDYARPRAGTLDLALARYRATGDKQGSVLLNFGGPGGAGIPEFASGGKDFMELTDGYDIVTFDPRGVGRSSPVSCGDGEENVDVPEDGTDLGRDPRSVLDQLKKAAEACARHSGPVLPHIGTVNASRDLDVIRQALGDKKLNYLGFSYGTRLGAVYAAQFPEKVGRLVLDGVDTLTEPLTEQGVAGAKGQQKALEEFINWCVKDIACPFGQDAREARKQVVRLVDSLDEDPVPTAFGEPFTGQDLVGAIGQALYSEELWPSLERALASLVEDGDTHAIESFATGGAAPAEPGSREETEEPDGGLVADEEIPLDNAPAALMAINCADDPDRPTAEQIIGGLDRLRAEYEQASPVFGHYRLTGVLMCYGRPRGTDFIRDEVKNVDTPKMLLVGTRGDPATPYRWTEETARRLGSSAVVLDNKGSGHTGYASSKCVHRKVDAFLLYGTLPPDGSSCGPEDGRE
ncbi:alpha/beta fold hydrolase [Streptomyces sp. ISL-22]|uniref:alpha/beta hydrolase n=1 Tax=unclassified Streptomyces TaxID=2593676 RepID=UPI001BE56B27|nr:MULTISPECIES: alpha/beta hydrolase [unclassified Streptomyces]MBT2420126.1 alpha/beta fold hydrolase [Streptomyces sp. ISL-24]MBT2433260.1 alpha/beta fold hydrolase [Streptomyces sp. ISL-22]